MKIELGKIEISEYLKKIEARVFIKEDKTNCIQSAAVTVYIDLKNQTVSEIEAEAKQAAKEFLLEAANAEFSE